MSATYKLPPEYSKAVFKHAKERLAVLEAQEQSYVDTQRDREFLAQLTAAYMAASRYLHEEADS
jgi:hypothetical protein